ncbi:MAG: class I SAM-dependent methyltransferase [Phycisphaerales bacterium]|nr:MAG: class I SAM-dependent methyltransferase [Phycisphaerales bacterium]
MFEVLEQINRRPKPFEFYTTPLLWNDEHISKKMLELHLNETADPASRNQAFIDRSVAWIVDHFAVKSGTKIGDFGCGPGLYTTRLAERGARVTGVDLSERSIAHARASAAAKGLSIDYVLANYLDFSTDKRFDLIAMIYCDYCVLSPEQRRTLLAKFRAFLEPDGAVLLDVFSVDWLAGVEEQRTYECSSGEGFWSVDPHYVFLNRFKYEPQRLYLDKYTIFERTRTREIYNWLQAFDLPALQKEFAESGFEIVEHYANVAGDMYQPGATEIAVVARLLS